MAFLHSHSCECTKSELDLFAIPPTQTSIRNSQWVHYKPLSSINDDSPLGFVVSGAGDEYIDLGHTLIHVVAKVVKTDGTDTAEEQKVGPVNNFLHSLFSQVDVYLNQKLISPPSNTYAYRCYVENLLSYGPAAKKSHLTISLWYDDTSISILCPMHRARDYQMAITDPEKEGNPLGADPRRPAASLRGRSGHPHRRSGNPHGMPMQKVPQDEDHPWEKRGPASLLATRTPPLREDAARNRRPARRRKTDSRLLTTPAVRLLFPFPSLLFLSIFIPLTCTPPPHNPMPATNPSLSFLVPSPHSPSIMEQYPWIFIHCAPSHLTGKEIREIFEDAGSQVFRMRRREGELGTSWYLMFRDEEDVEAALIMARMPGIFPRRTTAALYARGAGGRPGAPRPIRMPGTKRPAGG
ncbi:hypothetical protein J437_LFUL019261 [Ladona fulva]|uniref:Uncharacterized protein n=1 Tax=Ladona fulva TaxID=123851 RepID=A0A8K0PAV5_LADFU|nr:hypothetical protein J437_LFUL019261 [Ladona fulva]